MGLTFGDYVITEAGFASELEAEKFLTSNRDLVILKQVQLYL